MIPTSLARLAQSMILATFFGVVLMGCAQPAGTSTSSTDEKSAADKTPAAAGTATTDPNPATDDAKPKAAGFLNDWKKPAVALMLSGEQHGYLEPCGCSETQSGGMARRADLFEKLVKDRGWNVVGLDLGGTLKRSRRQDEIKFDQLFEAFRQLNYAAIGVGVEELKLGADFLLTRKTSDEVSPALVSANVVLFDQPDLEWPLPHRLIEKGGVKIAVTGIFGPSLTDKVAPAGVVTNISIRNPDDVLPGVIKNLEALKPDLMVLLCHGNDAEAKQYAKAYPQFKIVLAAGGYDEPDGKPIPVGESWVLNVGHKGKRVGVLGFYPDDKANPFRFELIQLDKDRFQNHPAMRQLMRDYQQQLQDEGIAESEQLLINSHPSGQTYVGAEKCAGCHSKAFEHWKETGHARAFTTLKEGPWHENRAEEKIGWIPRQFDPECLSCHVTGWNPQEMLRYGSGYVKEQVSPHLLGQQCENCHGPASLHVSREEAGAAMDELLEGRRMVKRTLAEAKKTMCIECHDPDNSPKFTPDRFDAFWDEVKHPWKD
ncbi:multiheme c-type cytochrome [Schlesneria paludicola]|uniref:multiheme c-type cytochrome n=1 Tax=Schlesneria paludicola TaxID=360056 RepID=UPI00029A9CAC|nr:multiheme c-type cytochrome [Schlesneria paludicola]